MRALKTLKGLWLALVLVSGSAAVASSLPKPIYLPEQDRKIEGERPVRLVIEQSQIDTSFDLGRVAFAGSGGGLLGALIVAAHDDRRKTMGLAEHDKAEAYAGPLRSALRDFDANALALSATKAGLAKSDWFQAQAIATSSDPSSAGDAAFAAANPSPQIATIVYRYELSPDFSQIRVLGEITLTKHDGKNHDADTAPTNLIFRQRVLSVVQLGTRSYEPRENVARWSADGGKLAKTALTAAFGQFEQLLPYALGLSEKSVGDLTAKNHEKAFAAGFYGPLIAKTGDTPGDVLIWSDGLVQVHTLP